MAAIDAFWRVFVPRSISIRTDISYGGRPNKPSSKDGSSSNRGGCSYVDACMSRPVFLLRGHERVRIRSPPGVYRCTPAKARTRTRNGDSQPANFPIRPAANCRSARTAHRDLWKQSRRSVPPSSHPHPGHQDPESPGRRSARHRARSGCAGRLRVLDDVGPRRKVFRL